MRKNRISASRPDRAQNHAAPAMKGRWFSCGVVDRFSRSFTAVSRADFHKLLQFNKTSLRRRGRAAVSLPTPAEAIDQFGSGPFIHGPTDERVQILMDHVAGGRTQALRALSESAKRSNGQPQLRFERLAKFPLPRSETGQAGSVYRAAPSILIVRDGRKNFFQNRLGFQNIRLGEHIGGTIDAKIRTDSRSRW